MASINYYMANIIESVTIIELATTGNTCEYCASSTNAFIYTYFT
jgi:hypothetical protein